MSDAVRPRIRLAALVLAAAACSSLEPIPPADHVVRAPISDRANVVLRNTVAEYGSDDGRWRGSMSPGCSVIWATQFGYRAGVRRDRDDVVAIGRATAKRASSGIRGIVWASILGEVASDDPAMLGYPALLVSGALGGRCIDELLFAKGLDRIEAARAGGTLRAREHAGLAVLLSEVARLQPEHREERLAQARASAAEAGGSVLAFLAWAAVARASGEEEDLRRAREAEAAMPYRFDAGALVEPPAKDEVLSLHLAAIHGWADLVQATGDARCRAHAVAMLDHVFSDAYFDGRFLAHDRLGGERSKDVCSGCNWMALYLVDRLYGDSFVIDPVPELPERDWPEEEDGRRAPLPPGYAHELVLEPGTDGKPGETELVVRDAPPRARLRFSHAARDAEYVVEYEILPPDPESPHGSVRLAVRPRGEEATPNEYTLRFAFDPAGRAALSTSWGVEPLTYFVEFARREDGALAATFRLRERP